ncbi:MAG: RNA polymerase factor sigma-54 [Gammaproteobacteria bacterium]|nr:MAG: RNA polymerase factor sigma-54 [Gammaproteobacteria bacterium]
MKQALNLKLGQQLTLTPQLQQAIRLLQLSSIDLHTEIQQTLDSNPLLEVVDEQPENTPSQESDENTANSPDTPPDEAADSGLWEQNTASSYEYTSGPARSENFDQIQNLKAPASSLREHLLSQINLTPLNDTDQVIAMALIDAINEDGYLEGTLDNFYQDLGQDLEVTPEELEAVLHRVQRLDPPGVGARNLQESLKIQIEQIVETGPAHQLAMSLICDHFDLLAERDQRKILKRIKVDESDLANAMDLVRSLNPRPGSAISNHVPEYVIPDVYVRKRRNEWNVELNPDLAPRLSINRYYAELIKRADNSRDNQFLKNNLLEARWFIKSLQNRNDTLLKVAHCIIEKQRTFMEYGEEGMNPLVLKDIADAVEMHESTISRVTTQKYMHTPRGIFEFKYFFSSHVGTTDGGECSATAIRAMIKKLISTEDTCKPFSDSQLANILSERGINVARRTVAKYRENLSIPASNERRIKV